MDNMNEPEIISVIESEGEVDDSVDYFVNNLVMRERGMGFTACSPSLVEIKTDESEKEKVIKFGLDHTYVDDKGQVMGYGIVGYMYVSIADEPQNMKVFYLTPKEILEEKINYIHENNIEATPRPRGKY